MRARLKPRHSRSKRQPVAWGRIRTSKGWGLHNINPDSVLSLFSKKRFILSIVFLSVLGSSIVLAQGPLFHSQVPNPAYSPGQGADPLVPLFTFCDSTANLAAFDQRGASFFTNINGCGSEGILLTSNSTAQAFAINQNPIHLDTAGSHNLQISFGFQWYLPGNANSGSDLYMFLTTNKTLFRQDLIHAINNDPSIFYVTRISHGTNTFSEITYIKDDPTRTLTSLDTGCGSGGSAFICTANYASNNLSYNSITTLNYTGISTAQALSSTVVSQQGAGPATTTKYAFPPVFFQSLTFYWGIAMDANSNSVQGLFYDNVNPPNQNPGPATQNNWLIALFAPAASTPTAPASIDTGGVFGPIIRALISLGVFIVQNVINFLTFLASLLWPLATAVLNQLANGIKLALNAIGSFFGWGALGDNLFTFTAGVVSAVVQTLSAISSYISDIVNRVLNFLTIVSTISGQIFGSSGLLANLFTLASNSFTQLVTIFSKLVLLGSPALTVAVYLSYFDAVATGGLAGFASWWNFMRWLAFGFINVTVTIINRAVTAITDLLSYIPTIAAHMPEQGLPAIPTLQNTNFPGFPITGAGTKFREGDFGAVALFLFGGGLLMALFALNVPGVNPLANLTASSGCNPRDCFNTAFQSVFLPFTTVFTLVIFAGFATQILFAPAQPTETGPLIRIVTKDSSRKIPRGLKPASAKPKGRAFERRVVARADRFIQAEYGSQNE